MLAAVRRPSPQHGWVRIFPVEATSRLPHTASSHVLTTAGNKPPWTLPAKAAYSKYDSARAKKYFGVPNIKTPDFFPILSLLPQRALVYVKEAHPQAFIQVFCDLFQEMWENGVDVSKPDLLSRVLSKRFPEADVKAILEKANSAPYKQRLNDNTKEALDRGAFGCPWFFVRNSTGEEEPFFGSDRYVLPASTILLWQETCVQYSARHRREGV
jgi:2-hydroxychromene-2-carboxylate isomerase